MGWFPPTFNFVPQKLIGCEAVVNVCTLSKLAYTRLTCSFKKKFKYGLPYRGPTQVDGDNSCGEVGLYTLDDLACGKAVRSTKFKKRSSLQQGSIDLTGCLTTCLLYTSDAADE